MSSFDSESIGINSVDKVNIISHKYTKIKCS